MRRLLLYIVPIHFTERYAQGIFTTGQTNMPTQEKKKTSGDRKWKAQTRALYPVLSLKIRFYSYLVENSQNVTLNFYFKSRFSVKPSKLKYILQTIVAPQKSVKKCKTLNEFKTKIKSWYPHHCLCRLCKTYKAQ